MDFLPPYVVFEMEENAYKYRRRQDVLIDMIQQLLESGEDIMSFTSTHPYPTHQMRPITHPFI